MSNLPSEVLCSFISSASMVSEREDIGLFKEWSSASGG